MKDIKEWLKNKYLLKNCRLLDRRYLIEAVVKEIDRDKLYSREVLPSDIKLIEFNDMEVFGHCDLEQFTNIEEITNPDYLSFKNEITFAFSNNSKLTKLNLSHFSNLKNLDLKNNLNLMKLELAGCELADLDLSKNTKLEIVNLSNNELTDLNLSKNINLISLDVSYNKLVRLDLRKNVNLTSFWCTDNPFEEKYFVNKEGKSFISIKQELEKEKQKCIFLSKCLEEIYEEIRKEEDINKNEVKKKILVVQIQSQTSELEQMKDFLKNRLDENLCVILETLIEAQKQLALLENVGLTSVVNIAKSQLLRTKKSLEKVLTDEEINNLCQKQEKLAKLDLELERVQEQKLETKIEINK